MTFTYDLAETGDNLVYSKIRLEIGDTTEDSGVKPGGGNFTDEELAVFYADEGSIMRAVARCCEVLARTWSRVASIAVGPRRESLSDVAKSWAKQAAEMRAKYGGGMAISAAGVIRVDGYSDDIASDEVDSSSDYELDFEYVTPEG